MAAKAHSLIASGLDATCALFSRVYDAQPLNYMMDAIWYTPRVDRTQDLHATALGLSISGEMRAWADEGSGCLSRITRHGTAASILY